MLWPLRAHELPFWPLVVSGPRSQDCNAWERRSPPVCIWTCVDAQITQNIFTPGKLKKEALSNAHDWLGERRGACGVVWMQLPRPICGMLLDRHYQPKSSACLARCHSSLTDRSRGQSRIALDSQSTDLRCWSMFLPQTVSNLLFNSDKAV